MEIFDLEAKNYDSWYKTRMGDFVDRVETDLALSMFKPEKSMRVLDLGCGTGNFTIKLKELGCDVVGLDISDEMLKEARKKAQDKSLDIEFVKGDIYNLDFPDQSFDAVFSMAAFEFIKEDERAYEEMYRVLKEGGQLLIGTINKDSSWGELYLSDDFQENSVFKHADLKSPEDLKSLNPEKLIDFGECLFVSPTSREEDFNLDKEKELSQKERGGFICALWEK